MHRARAHKSIHECKSPVNRIEASDTSMDFLLLPGPSHWRPFARAPTSHHRSGRSCKRNEYCTDLEYTVRYYAVPRGAAFQLSMANYRSWKGSGTRNAKKYILPYLSDLIRRSVPVCPVFLSIFGRSLLDGARNFTIVPNCMPIGA